MSPRKKGGRKKAPATSRRTRSSDKKSDETASTSGSGSARAPEATTEATVDVTSGTETKVTKSVQEKLEAEAEAGEADALEEHQKEVDEKLKMLENEQEPAKNGATEEKENEKENEEVVQKASTQPVQAVHSSSVHRNSPLRELLQEARERPSLPFETPTKKRRTESVSPHRPSLGGGVSGAGGVSSSSVTSRVHTEASISQLFQRRDLKALSSVAQDLSRKTDKSFQDYKKLAERRAKAAEQLVASLTKENSALKNQVKTLKTEKRPSKDLDVLKRQVEQFKLAEKKAAEELEMLRKEKRSTDNQLDEAVKEIDLFNTKQEMIELLCGVTCVGYDENQKSITFRMKQLGDSCTLFYELIISKSGIGELVYIPLLKRPEEWDDNDDGDWDPNLTSLKQVLPDYLLDNLTFPANTLRNFYAKITRSIGKRT